jgi:hypothetical protein
MMAAPPQSFSNTITVTSACAANGLADASDTVGKHEESEYPNPNRWRFHVGDDERSVKLFPGILLNVCLITSVTWVMIVAGSAHLQHMSATFDRHRMTDIRR